MISNQDDANTAKYNEGLISIDKGYISEGKIFENFSVEILGIVLIFLVTILANAAGASASGILIPFFLLFFKLTLSQSIPIATFISFTSTLIRFLINFNKKHPKKHGCNQINYEIVQITCPFVFFGSFFGVAL